MTTCGVSFIFKNEDSVVMSPLPFQKKVKGAKHTLRALSQRRIFVSLPLACEVSCRARTNCGSVLRDTHDSPLSRHGRDDWFPRAAPRDAIATVSSFGRQVVNQGR